MTEKEIQLIEELQKEKEQRTVIENIITKKQGKLKECKQKIIDLELAIKEEQLNSIRESIDKNGFDFNAFREALEKGQLSSILPLMRKNTELESDEQSETGKGS